MFRDLFPWAAGISSIQKESVRLAKLGQFEGVDPNIDEAAELVASGAPAEAFRAIFTAEQMKVGVWYLPCYTDLDDAAYAAAMEKVRKLAPVAAAIGVTRAGSVIRSWSDTRAYDENLAFNVERFKPVAAVLKEQDLRLGLEYVGPSSVRAGHKHDFISTQDGALKLCDAIDTGNLGLTLDCFHWYTSGGTLDDIRSLPADRITIVHVNDAPDLPMERQTPTNRAMPGETGVIDLTGFLRAVKATGFDGPVAPEPFSEKIRKLPHELSARLLGGYFKHAWDAAFSEEQPDGASS